MKYLIFFMLIISAQTSASVVDEFVCYDDQHQRIPVNVIPVPHNGEAYTEDGRKTISIDETLVATLDDDSLLFILLHECGHHVLDDYRYTHYLYKTQQNKKVERAADCFAARTLTKTWGSDHLNHALTGLFHINGKDRNHEILNCIAN